MIENTTKYVRSEVLERVAKAFGIDTAQRIESLDDYCLLSVYNYYVNEYWHGDDEIFTSLEELVDMWEPKPMELAEAVAYGAGTSCFCTDHWLYFNGYGHLEFLYSGDRREFMLERLAYFDKDKLHEALEYCGYLEE